MHKPTREEVKAFCRNCEQRKPDGSCSMEKVYPPEMEKRIKESYARLLASLDEIPHSPELRKSIEVLQLGFNFPERVLATASLCIHAVVAGQYGTMTPQGFVADEEGH